MSIDLVADIAPGPVSSAPQSLIGFSDHLVFSAEQVESGRELWTANSDNETQLIKDILPGPLGSQPSNLAATVDHIFFFADDGSHGRELWKTDGTQAGTNLVLDITAGVGSTQPIETATTLQHYFFVNRISNSYELWSSDGTADGTATLMPSNQDNPIGKISQLASTTELVYFHVQSKDHALWRSDGTQQGTFPIANFGNRHIHDLTVVGDILFFRNSDAIWQSAGTASGTVEVIPAKQNFRTQRLTAFEDELAFQRCSRLDWSTCQQFVFEPHSGEVTDAHRRSTITFSPSSSFGLEPLESNIFFEFEHDWLKKDGVFIGSGWQRTAIGIKGSGPGVFKPSRWADSPRFGLWSTDLTVSGTLPIVGVDTEAQLGEVELVGETVYAALQIDEEVGNELYRLSPDTQLNTVEFADSHYQVAEDGTPIGGAITVSRAHAHGSQQVAVQVVPITADLDSDIAGFAGYEFPQQNFVLEFAAGERSKELSILALTTAEVDELEAYAIVGATQGESIVTLLDDEIHEPTKSIQLRLWPLSSNLEPAGNKIASITIVDDDEKRIDLAHTDIGTKIIADGAADSLAVQLNFPPNKSVVVKPTYDSEFLDVTPKQLTFVPDNWSLPQLFHLTGVRPIQQTPFSVAIDQQRSDVIAHEVPSTLISIEVGSGVEFVDVAPGIRIADINRDTVGISPRDLTAFDDRVFFTADDGIHGREIWSSDGTRSGTSLFLDIAPGQRSSFPDRWRWPSVTAIRDKLFFISNDPQKPSLWASDGSRTGTVLIREFESPLSEIIATEGKVFFQVGHSLWASDGTPSGTEMVLQRAHVDDLLVFGEELVFNAKGTIHISDGTPTGTKRLAPVEATSYAILDNTLYFTARGRSDRADSGIWKSDGSVGGTSFIQQLEITAKVQVHGESLYISYFGLDWILDPSDDSLTRLDTRIASGRLFTFADQTYIASSSIRLVDGSRRITITQELSGVNQLHVTPNAFYFTAFADRRRELWRSNGTASGTYRVADLTVSELSVGDRRVLMFDNALWFAGNDETSGVELWKIDLPDERAMQISEDPRGSDAGINGLFAFRDELYFEATDGITPALQLYKTNSESAILLKIIPAPEKLIVDPNFPGSRPIELKNWIAVDDELFFTHAFGYTWASGNGQLEFELWKTDGTGLGTTLELPSYYSFFAEDMNDIGPTHQTVFGGKLYYETYRFRDNSLNVLPSELFDRPAQFTVVGNQLFFSAEGVEDGRELWVTSDARDFRQLTDIGEGVRPGLLRRGYPTLTQRSELVEFKNELFFTAGVNEARFAAEVEELWKTDGTVGGTQRVAGPGHGHIANPVVAGESVFFTTENPPILWATDGRVTRKIREFDDLGKDFVAFNGDLYFSAANDLGRELWKSDGTESGTLMVADIAEGNFGSNPGSFVIAGDQLFFAANDVEHGRELWVTTGLQDTTRLYLDLHQGEGSSDPTNPNIMGETLYVVANDGRHGRELFQIETNLVPPPKGDLDGDRRVGFSDFLLFAANFGKRVHRGASVGDFDENEVVDFRDFLFFSSLF